MSPPKLTREMCQAAVDALAKYGSQVLAARAMGISRSAFQHRLAEADMPTRDPDVVVEPLTSRERFDAAFWRKKAADAQRAADEAEHVAEQLAGIRGVEWSIPEWIMAAGDGDKGRSVIGCLVSDMHMGEVIDAEEMSGVNAFNPDICRERMRRYFEAACIVGKRWAADTHCEGALLALGGVRCQARSMTSLR